MAITTMDGLVAAMAAGSKYPFIIPSVTNVANYIVNVNRASANLFGTMPAAAAFGSGGTTYNGTNAGFPNIGAAGSGLTAYLTNFHIVGATAGCFHVYDYIWSCSGMNGTLATAQSVVGFPTLPRFANGIGLELWAEVFTATGSTATTITASYTNTADVAARTTAAVSWVASSPAYRMYRFPLAAGDLGVKSVQSATLAATTGTVGSFGLALMNYICTIPVPIINVGQVLDFASLGMPTIADNAALVFLHQATTTSSGLAMGSFTISDG